MKKILLFAAAAVALCANADYYVIGGNVNGANWTSAAEDAKMTEKSAGVYEWTGTVLGTGFKINDGTWDNPDAIFGSNGSVLTPGTPYSYNVGGQTGNIEMSVEVLANPCVILDTNTQTITVTGQEQEITSYEVYLAGEFNKYTPSDADKFTKGENGVYTLHLDSFNSDFKVVINGAWLGYVEGPVESGVSYTLVDTGMNNSVLSGAATDVTFSCDPKAKTLTVTYTAGGQTVTTPEKLYVLGNLGEGKDWNSNAGVELTKNGNKFEGQVILCPQPEATAVYFSFVTNLGKDWDADVNAYDRYGAIEGDAVITANTPVEFRAYKAGVDASSAAAWQFDTSVPVEVFMTVDFENMTVLISGVTGVAEIEAAEEAPVYFNLQGVKVANPENGIFVKVQGGKTSKVVVK